MIHYVANMDGLEEIESALGMMKDKSKYVLRAAINNAAKEVEKRMVTDAKNRYVIKGGKSAIKEANKIKKATVSNLAAIIEAKGAPLDLTEYKVSPQTYFPGSKGAPSWIRAKTLRSGKLKRMALQPGSSKDKYKGFVVKYSNGHIAFAERVPGTRMRGRPEKEAIRSLYATSKPKAEEVVFKNSIVNDVNTILMRNIQEQIQRFLK